MPAATNGLVGSVVILKDAKGNEVGWADVLDVIEWGPPGRQTLPTPVVQLHGWPELESGFPIELTVWPVARIETVPDLRRVS